MWVADDIAKIESPVWKISGRPLEGDDLLKINREKTEFRSCQWEDEEQMGAVEFKYLRSVIQS